MNLEKGTIVTVELTLSESGTFIVDRDEGGTVLVSHPLARGLLIRVDRDKLNKTSANVKTSIERCIDYANANTKYLDYGMTEDLVAIGMLFAIKRRLSSRQKQNIANMCGTIATVKFNDDIKTAMIFIAKNHSVLDEFNAMWFNNFKGLFTGTQPITSKKQRSAIFNIAGYVLAELENPTVQTSK